MKGIRRFADHERGLFFRALKSCGCKGICSFGPWSFYLVLDEIELESSKGDCGYWLVRMQLMQVLTSLFKAKSNI
jgi:hypothetical protein